MAHDGGEAADTVRCPVCSGEVGASGINAHLDTCLLSNNGGHLSNSKPDTASEIGPPMKKARLSLRPGASAEHRETEQPHAAPLHVFSVFHAKNRATKADKPVAPPSGGCTSPEEKRREQRETPTAAASSPDAGPPVPGHAERHLSISSLLDGGKPLAEKIRPSSLEEYFGQNKAVGENTLLRRMLESADIPSLILWGPPGCGKTTLAHIIATNCKKKGSTRFVTLSATSTTTNEVREVIKQAQNELRLCKRKTILFIDEIHRFNKSQQDTFLPHVECGTVTLIGATTENPSFQVNAALLSRCRVLVLERLSAEAMAAVLERAVSALGLRVLGSLTRSLLPEHKKSSTLPKVYIEQKALDTIAHLCDGDARSGLNGLQMAIQARINASKLDAPAQDILVQEDHVKEGLQRSHILYDKAGEEHYNCISALHKSMRGSHENAALYWLGRMLEGGEDPLYVARRLVRFASEDVGIADPSALPQAVSAFQACHFIGMPECEVILAQCVVYLARAPKSVEVYKAYDNVKTCLRTHRGPLPPVPLHLRNAPTRLMKELGYAKGYKYNPAFSEPVEQEYLPAELKGIDFFTWQPSDQ
uniref:WRN helicase interacting protein 1 n=1 Tax=Paramormyrops kingsleyae TaxID=1676925 RepID=A0A3B3R5Y0_9TELE